MFRLACGIICVKDMDMDSAVWKACECEFVDE